MKDYITHHLVPYEEPTCRGYMEVPVLEFLKGKKWDEVALAYVHALRPTAIRVTSGIETLDCRIWRVNVHVNNYEDLIIEEIEQEVEVGLPDGIQHGEALRMALHYGIDSEQVKWYQDAESYSLVFGRYYKHTVDGKMVLFPGTKTNDEDVDGDVEV